MYENLLERSNFEEMNEPLDRNDTLWEPGDDTVQESDEIGTDPKNENPRDVTTVWEVVHENLLERSYSEERNEPPDSNETV